MSMGPVSKDPVSQVIRLSNRAAALAFASAFTVIVALVSLPQLWRPGAGPRAAAAAALTIAVVVTGWAWRARAQLRAARQRSERPESPEVGAEQARARDGAHSTRLLGAHPPKAGGAPRPRARSARG